MYVTGVGHDYFINEDEAVEKITLCIEMDELPAQMAACGASGYYRDQIWFHLGEPDSGSEYPLYVHIFVHMNPMYDAAVRTLLGRDAWQVFTDRTFLHQIVGDDTPYAEMFEPLHTYEFSIEQGKHMLNLLAHNSTFTS